MQCMMLSAETRAISSYIWFLRVPHSYMFGDAVAAELLQPDRRHHCCNNGEQPQEARAC